MILDEVGVAVGQFYSITYMLFLKQTIVIVVWGVDPSLFLRLAKGKGDHGEVIF